MGREKKMNGWEKEARRRSYLAAATEGAGEGPRGIKVSREVYAYVCLIAIEYSVWWAQDRHRDLSPRVYAREQSRGTLYERPVKLLYKFNATKGKYGG